MKITTETTKHETVIVNANFANVLCLLQDDHAWMTDLLVNSGKPPMIVKWVRFMSKTRLVSGIIPENSTRFVTWGLIGINAWVAYQIERIDDQTIKLTPIPFLPLWQKVVIALSLAIFLVVPVVLAPVFWKLKERNTLQNGWEYLQGFCRLVGSENSENF